MATYTVAAGSRGKHEKTLVASTVDTVTFADDCDQVEVLSDASANVYFTVDGSTPTVQGDNCFRLSTSAPSLKVDVPTSGGTVVRLISSGTPVYSVTRAA